MEKLAYVEFLLKDYHQMKKRVEYMTRLMESPLLESYEDTIEELNYKNEEPLERNRGP